MEPLILRRGSLWGASVRSSLIPMLRKPQHRSSIHHRGEQCGSDWIPAVRRVDLVLDLAHKAIEYVSGYIEQRAAELHPFLAVVA